MNYKRLLKLFWEFADYVASLHTLYLDSIAGYSILHDRLLNHQQNINKILGDHEYATEQFQDTCSMKYKELCNKDFSPVSMSPLMKQGDIKKRTKEDGHNYLLLGNQCLVAAYSYWEEYLRIEIGKAVGILEDKAVDSKARRKILNKYIISDLWGDIKYLRHSIIHNNGIANSDIGKCKIFKWFKPGDPIALDYEKMRVIFLKLGAFRNELHNMSLPKKIIKLPG